LINEEIGDRDKLPKEPTSNPAEQQVQAADFPVDPEATPKSVPVLGATGQSVAPQPAEVEFRLALVSFLAAALGLVAGLVAYLLYSLIGLFTNIFFSITSVSPLPVLALTI
jgi:hypothetical protein